MTPVVGDKSKQPNIAKRVSEARLVGSLSKGGWGVSAVKMILMLFLTLTDVFSNAGAYTLLANHVSDQLQHSPCDLAQ